jgi:D-cysteine desulfhydrase
VSGGVGIARLPLAHLPTPLEQPKRLGEALGVDLWVKRDDATGGPEAGNKIRKLEYLFADAIARGCDSVITCGGLQSNHARATALLAARLGLRAVLLLRMTELDDDGDGAGIASHALAPAVGNLLLDRLAGAEILLITAASYRRRGEIMQRHAQRLDKAGARPYVIPEGGSNGLGALGYLRAMQEVKSQLDQLGHQPFDLVVHACGSGGTAAGVALGIRRHQVATRLVAMAVCDDAAYFETSVRAIIDECRALDGDVGEPGDWRVDDRFKGPAYAVSTEAQRSSMIEATRLSGLVFDPVYTGKAFFGLAELARSGRLDARRVLFLHTGGLPGLLAQASSFATGL